MNSRKAKPNAADRAAAQRLSALWAKAVAKARDGGGARLTQEAAAERMEMTQAAVSQYLRGTIPLGYGATLKFAQLLGVSPSEIRPDLDALPKDRLSTDEYDDIRATTQGVALGAGAVPEEYAETHSLKFKSSSLRRKGLRAPQLEIYYGSGDSMEPRIHDGDAILVDRSDTRVVDDKIYFIRYDGHFFVKRLQMNSGMLFIVSDNRDNPQWRKPILVKPSDDFEVIGRVRWLGSWED